MALNDLYTKYWLLFDNFMKNYKEKNKNQTYITDYNKNSNDNITSQQLNTLQQQNINELEEMKNNSNEYLECIPFVNQTQYDFLKGFSIRYELISQPEPEYIKFIN